MANNSIFQISTGALDPVLPDPRNFGHTRVTDAGRLALEQLKATRLKQEATLELQQRPPAKPEAEKPMSVPYSGRRGARYSSCSGVEVLRGFAHCRLHRLDLLKGAHVYMLDVPGPDLDGQEWYRVHRREIIKVSSASVELGAFYEARWPIGEQPIVLKWERLYGIFGMPVNMPIERLLKMNLCAGITLEGGDNE